MPDLIRVYAGDLVKTSKNDDGTITVYGKAAGPDLDNDQQILDPAWLAREMPAWFQQWGNIREMHQAKAVGKAVEMDAKDEDWFLTGRIVDPDAVRKVDEGVYQGWSVGVKRPRIQRDLKAPGGRVVGGKIIEVSLADHPANETCKLVLAKAASDTEKLEPVEELVEAEPWPWRVRLNDYLGKVAEVNRLLDAGDVDAAEQRWNELDAELGKRDVSTAERNRLASEGDAMPGGGFPIANVQDLKNAIRAIGRAKDRAATIAHIKRRARALGREDLIPDAWKAQLPDLAKFTATDIQSAIRAICSLIVEEAQDLARGDVSELWDITNLLEAVRCLVTFWSGEAREGTVSAPGDTEDSIMTLSQLADLAKAATADDASEEDRAAWAEVRASLGLDGLATLPEQIADATKTAVEEATKTVGATVEGLAGQIADATKTVVAEATKTATAAVAGLADRVGKLEAQPAQGALPARTAPTTPETLTKASRADTLREEIGRLQGLANAMNTDPNGRAGLLLLAGQKQRELDALS